MATILNAKIKSTMLGYEDHGILTFMLYLDCGDGTSQGFGGYQLDTPVHHEGHFLGRAPTKAPGLILKRILETVGVERWEDLRGKVIRIQRREEVLHAPITRIGHMLDDKWFDVVELEHVTAYNP